MNSKEHESGLIRVTQSFQKYCTIWFAAPYSQGEEITLPEDLILKLTVHPELDESVRYEVCPVDSKAWAPFLISRDYRSDKNFRYGYNMYLTREELEQNCEPVSEDPDTVPKPLRLYRALQGSLFGTAVGDAIGLPYEGMSARRIKKLKAFPLRHHFLFGRGMLSDDTEHTCIVAHALIFAVNDLKEFSSNLAWSLRFWVLGLPAGIGMATLKACLKLWLFISPDKSGVFSAGNGPAMRSALIGVYAYDDKTLREQLIGINTRITHTDPKALKGSKIVAELAARNTEGKPLATEDCLQELQSIIGDDDELKSIVQTAIESAKQDETAEQYCQNNGQAKGVGGYIYHTLPVVLQIVLRHNDNFEQAISEAIRCGGDTDTVAAIIGGIVGANVGKDGIPEDWIENLTDWPRTKPYLQFLVDEMCAVKWLEQPGTTYMIDPIRLWIRNAFFMLWVLAHGFRRLLPPY